MTMNAAKGYSGGSDRRVRFGVVVAALAALLGAFGTDTPASAQSSNGSLARALPELKPGDGIRLRFWREPALNGDYFVDETGTVTLPLLGTIEVTGIPADELKRDLIRDLEAQLVNQAVQLSLLTRVRILGAVQRPGLYHVDPTMMVGDAVALAGGATPNGKLDAIRVIRGGDVVLSKISQTDPVTTDVRSGDQIFVPERSWLARNGAVVLGALISAGGLIVAQAIF